MKAKSHAILYRVWAYAAPLGWDCTIAQAAKEINEPAKRVRRIVGLAGWGGRFRSVTPEWHDAGPPVSAFGTERCSVDEEWA